MKQLFLLILVVALVYILSLSWNFTLYEYRDDCTKTGGTTIYAIQITPNVSETQSSSIVPPAAQLFRVQPKKPSVPVPSRPLRPVFRVHTSFSVNSSHPAVFARTSPPVQPLHSNRSKIVLSPTRAAPETKTTPYQLWKSAVSLLTSSNSHSSTKTMSPSAERSLMMEYRRPYLALRRSYLEKTREWRRYHLLMDTYKKKVARGRPAIPPQTPVPTPSPPPIVESPDFNGMDPPATHPVSHRFFRSSWSPGENVHIRQFVGNNEVPFRNETVYPSDTQEIAVTYVAVATYSRVFFIPYLLERWNGSMSLVFYGTDLEESRFVSYFQQHDYPDRLSMVLYLVRNGTEAARVFPINKLRNIGIRNTRSTHYIVFDMDAWPSSEVYASLVSLPPKIMMDPKSLVIVPIFFFDLGVFLTHCRELSSCVKLGMNYFPNNVMQFRACLTSRICLLQKASLYTHAYATKMWPLWKSGQVAKLRCVMNDYQEPYVVLRRSPQTPLFDERFVNYGYNKVQLIEQLRYMGYQFYILMDSFAMDLPHRASSFKRSFNSHINETSSMKNIYEGFQADLVKKYGAKPSLKICQSPKMTDLYISV